MKLRKKRSADQTLHDAIRGSVPAGKLNQARIVLSDAQKLSQLVGCTTYGKADVVERLMLPRGEDGYASTVRSHEARHATYSKRWSDKVRKLCKASERMMLAVNIIEDCHVEQKPLPCLDASALRAYSRDHMFAAMCDIREIVKHKRQCDKNPKAEFNNPVMRNGRILCGCRALCMINHYSAFAESGSIVEAQAAIQQAVGTATYEVLNRIIAWSTKEKRKIHALRLLGALLEDEENDLPDEEVLKWPLIEGTGKGAGMRIQDLLPKKEWTSHDKKVSILPAPSGSIIRVNRYVNAIISGDSQGLFSRRYQRQPSGTVLIDASGSMHATTENVKRLCKMIPDATVAYYSGDDISRGVLAIYAEKNKRYGGELPTETLLGGNSVDMEALQWLQKQPQPWTLISDLGFCGSSFGGEEVAHAIVERETALKKLTVIPTFKKAFEIFASDKRKVALPTITGIRAGKHLSPEEDPETI